MNRNFLSLLLLFSCVVTNAQQNEKLSSYIHPIIGTERMGHTFPRATVPFGMVKLSPDTDTISLAK